MNTSVPLHNIGIITKRSDAGALQATRELTGWLWERGIRVTVTPEVATTLRLPASMARTEAQETLVVGQDLVVVIGGDGTFIAAARAVGQRDTPLLGINMGRLGFLTEVSACGMLPAMAAILAGQFRTEERMMLEVVVLRDEREVLRHRVLNDVVAHKGELARMVEFQVAIDGRFVFSSRADGLIVSTPTGSTAYALSAGGPIIHPSLDAILLVPICPHTLTYRPIAVPGRGMIEVSFKTRNPNRLLTLDGQTGFALIEGDRIHISQSPHPLRLLHPLDRDYFRILRDKLHWGETVGGGRG
ncbi:MAG: NAD(+)/NADH kinase [Magnetococcales bacterium]|nr:NAD(+)/NADH kinase [Magnetococcales bacterium]